MLGYEEIDESTLQFVDEGMPEVNKLQRQYAENWHPYFDACILVGVEDTDYVYDWREQAEIEQRRSKGLGALSSEEIKKFCYRFMLSYKNYLNRLMIFGISGIDRCLKFYLSKSRVPYIKE